MKRLALLVAAVAYAVLLGTAPAGAIETATFGIDVIDASPDRRLHVAIEAGERSTGRLRVWNKQDAPITLRLSVSPAQVDASGDASLGGDDDTADWVRIRPRTVVLPARAERTVHVEVDAPRRIDAARRTVAVVAHAAADGQAAPAVLERLAVTTFLEPDPRSLVASLGVYPWVAAACVVAAAAAVARRTRR